jgi:hypothetical protein
MQIFGAASIFKEAHQGKPIIDRIADQLPGWKADLMTKVEERFRFSLCSLVCSSI